MNVGISFTLKKILELEPTRDNGLFVDCQLTEYQAQGLIEELASQCGADKVREWLEAVA